MKAVYYRSHGSREVLEFGEMPSPTLAPNEVLVRLKFSALNHLDIWVREGIPGLKLPLPHVPGSDGAGVIEAIGGSVTRWANGMEVIVHPGLACGQCGFCQSGEESLCPDYKILGEHVPGTNAQFVKVPLENVFLKPKEMTWETAAAIPLVFTTAWHMLIRRAQIQNGAKVLIHAVGSGVSSAGIQIAKLYTDEIAVTSTSPEKLERARELGAKYFILPKDGNFSKEVKTIWKSGADIVFDHVGKVYWDQNIRILRNGGRLVTCGATSGFDAVTDLRHVFYRQVQILGSTMGAKADFPEILRHFGGGKWKAVIDTTFPLAQIKEAHARLEGRGQFGKILLKHE